MGGPTHEWVGPPIVTHGTNKEGHSSGWQIGEQCLRRWLPGTTPVRENQTCTNLRATVSRHVLPPFPGGGKAVDSCWRFCRNSRNSQRNKGIFGTGKRQIPLGQKGGQNVTRNGGPQIGACLIPRIPRIAPKSIGEGASSLFGGWPGSPENVSC